MVKYSGSELSKLTLVARLNATSPLGLGSTYSAIASLIAIFSSVKAENPYPVRV